jgi:Domain of unknown function (DUF4136)
MKTDRRAPIGWVLVLVMVAGGLLSAAKIKTRSQHDKTYDFRTVRTWDWDNPTPGKVIMLRSQDDDPEPVRQRFESTIMEAVASQLQSRGLARAAGAPPDLKATYYLIVKYNSSAQEMGQFLPATAFWGLPPFPPATTSFKVVQQGSLVVDLSAPSLESVVWRGIAETEVEPSKTDDERKERMREGIRMILEKFPPKK